MLVHQSNIGALEMLCGYGRVRVYQSDTGALWSLCWYSRILKKYSKGLVDRAEYYRSAREAVLVQHSTITALRRLCWYCRVL